MEHPTNDNTQNGVATIVVPLVFTTLPDTTKPIFDETVSSKPTKTPAFSHKPSEFKKYVRKQIRSSVAHLKPYFNAFFIFCQLFSQTCDTKHQFSFVPY